MLARVSLVLFCVMVVAGGWFWWSRPVDSNQKDPINQTTLEAAEQAFRQGSAEREDALKARRYFEEAADRYQQLCEESPSANLYFNLGNASLLANRLPEAILAFRQGLCLSPDDTVLRQNLAYARSMVGRSLKSEGSQNADDYPLWLPGPKTLFRWLSLAAYASCLPLLMLSFAQPRIRTFLPGTLLAIAFAVSAFLATRPGDERPIVVVAVDGAALRTGNGESYPPHPLVPALSKGIEGRQISQRGGWLFVELDSGETGWIRATELLVTPSSASPR